MKIFVLNTPEGLKPLYDQDYEEKRKLKLGEKYRVEIRKSRNPKFHRKFFAMINLAWENSERANQEFPNITAFRYSLIVKAGYFRIIYEASDKAIIQPESIAFDQMDDAKFEKVYSDVLDVILAEYIEADRQKVEEMLQFV